MTSIAVREYGRMDFGKYNGWPIVDIPPYYLHYILAYPFVEDDVKQSISDYFSRFFVYTYTPDRRDMYVECTGLNFGEAIRTNLELNISPSPNVFLVGAKPHGWAKIDLYSFIDREEYAAATEGDILAKRHREKSRKEAAKVKSEWLEYKSNI